MRAAQFAADGFLPAARRLVADARRHGVDVRPVDVRYSDWDCTLEEISRPSGAVPPLPLAGEGRGEGAFPAKSALIRPVGTFSREREKGQQQQKEQQPLALRLGMRLVNGLQQKVAERIRMARAQAAFRDLDDLVARADLDRGSLDRLAEAGALRGLAGHRHRARWQSAATEKQLPLFAIANAIDARSATEPRIAIPPPSAFEDTRADYASMGLTLGAHPVGLVRRQLQQRRYQRAIELAQWPDKRRARYAGLVILRQRPQTASGVTFMTLEDETGMVNVVVWAQVAERQRRVFLESQLMAVEGRMESAEGSQHLIATRLEDLSSLLGGVATSSRDFR